MSRSFLSLLSFVFLSVIFFACQKELSFELGQQAEGSLQGSGGECLPKTVNATYTAGQALGDTNWIEVSIHVSLAGNYSISTDTLNGYYFTASGNFGDTGIHIVHLQGSGTPLSAGINDFTITFNGTFCSVPVTVLPGSSSGGSAVFTLAGAGGGCTLSNVAGTYTVGTALDNTNQVVLNVDVAQAGTWSVTTNAVTGMSFSGSGTFSGTGPQTITLNGSGNPTTEGVQVVSVTAGGGSCTFEVTVNPGTSNPPPPGSDYFPRTANSNWGYEFDDDPTDTLMRLATDLTHSAASSTFTIFVGTDDITAGFDSAGYFRRDGGNYYEWHDIGGIYGFDNAIWQEYIFLKDDQPVGTSWLSPDISGTYQSAPITIREKFIILEKDVTVTVNGEAFPNTIVVEQRVEQFNGTSWTDVSDAIGIGTWYYARDIGLIKFDFTLNSQTSKTEIFRRLVY